MAYSPSAGLLCCIQVYWLLIGTGPLAQKVQILSEETLRGNIGISQAHIKFMIVTPRRACDRSRPSSEATHSRNPRSPQFSTLKFPVEELCTPRPGSTRGSEIICCHGMIALWRRSLLWMRIRALQLPASHLVPAMIDMINSLI